MKKVKIAVVYHSGYGHTASQAQAVAQGARRVEDTEVALIEIKGLAEDVPWETLAASDALIFGSPTYMGSVSASFKAFMEASSKVWFQLGWKDKIAAGFTNSGSASGDKLSSLIQLAIFAAQHGMLWVSLGIHGGNNKSGSSPEELNRLGSYLGAMSQSNVDQDASVAPPPSDLRTAEVLGERVARTALRFAASHKENDR